MISTSSAFNDAKIIRFEDLESSKSKHKDKKTVLVGGCFDLFHFGHLFFLEKAKEKNNFLIVALESDEFIVKRKQKQPVHTQAQRAQILSHLDLVDMVILLPFMENDKDYYRLTEQIKPNCVAITKDHPHLEHRKKQALLIGASVIEVDLIQEFSSSNIAKYAAVFSN